MFMSFCLVFYYLLLQGEELKVGGVCRCAGYKSCSDCRNGTSMISLIIPPKDQISRVSKMLADEFGTASNIKSRVNRLSVLGAITSVQQRLKLYNKGGLQSAHKSKQTSVVVCILFSFCLWTVSH